MDIDLSNWTLIKNGQLDGEFEGFNDEMIFELTDGSIYYQSNYKYNYSYSYRPAVKIYSNGYSKIIVVEGLDDYVEITETSSLKSTIISDFKGWSGEATFELQNGQIWKQDKYNYNYFYVYRPKALIVKIGSHHVMKVNGKRIRVKRIK